jgi:tRNA(Ile)-lysidine synthase
MMKNLVKHIQNINARHMLWTSGDTVIIGVSGGPDSMCLFDVMYSIAQKQELKIIVAHVNYGLRGKDSDRDQRAVEKYAKKCDSTCEIHQYKGDIYDENTLRTVRYTFFTQLMNQYGAKGILTAHTKNDQAETLLLHLLRGTGMQGLGGMKVQSQNHIMRPLLFTSRQDVLEYCMNHNIPYNIDKTNDDVLYTRNKIRNNLIPYLEKEFNPQIIDTLAKTTQILAEDYDFLKKQNEVFWDYDEKKKSVTFSVKDFERQHISMQRYSLRLMILHINKDTINIESGFVAELQKALMSHKNKQQEVTGKNLKMLRKGGIVELTCL